MSRNRVIKKWHLERQLESAVNHANAHLENNSGADAKITLQDSLVRAIKKVAFMQRIEGDPWYSNRVNQLDEVTVIASLSPSGVDGTHLPSSNSMFDDYQAIGKGIFGAKVINTTYGTVLNDYLKESLRTKGMGEIGLKELKLVQKSVSGIGAAINALDFYNNIIKFRKGRMSARRLTYKALGTGSSIYVGMIYGGLPGFTVGIIYTGGEYVYDGIKFDRAYNKRARKSDTYINNNGVRKQNRQNLSIENMSYYFSNGEF